MSLLTELSRSIVNAQDFEPNVFQTSGGGLPNPQSYNQLAAAITLPTSLNTNAPAVAVSSTGNMAIALFQQGPTANVAAFQTFLLQNGAWVLASTTTTTLTNSQQLSLSLSENNDLLAIGNGLTAEVVVYSLAATGNTWNQVGAKLTSAQPYFGAVVQVNDGVAAGLPSTLSVISNTGTSILFYSVSVKASTLTPSGTLVLPPVAGGFQNFTISIDFSTLAVANNYVSGGVGQVVVLSRLRYLPVSSWPVQQTLNPIGVSDANVFMGTSLSLSADGTVLAVGCPGDALNAPVTVGTTGAVLLYNYIEQTGRYVQGQKIIPLDYSPASLQALNFGSSLQLNFDGNTLVAGAWYEANQVGATWVFVLTASGIWIQNGNKLNDADPAQGVLFNEGVNVAIARGSVSVIVSSVTQNKLPDTSVVNSMVVYQSAASLTSA